MDVECHGESSLDSFVTASESDWTEVRETQFLDSAQYHTPCKTIDSSMLTIGKKIGEGGQAVIFEGLWHNDADGAEAAGNGAIKVAVKRFKMQATHTGPWPDDILKLKGGHLCRLHGYVSSENDLSTSLVMDRYECDLRSLIERSKTSHGNLAPFSATMNLSLIIQIASGMRCLHAHGIIHRDLKASNILVVDSTSATVDIVIADFEISSNALGSRFWRAPEILRVLTETVPCPARDMKISQAFSLKSDVYSFGMTCYEVLTGHSPLADLQACDYHAVLSGRRPDLPRHLNSTLRDLIHSCWHDTPAARPTFCEIIIGLRRVVADLGLPPTRKLVTCFHDDQLVVATPSLAVPATVFLFVESLKQYVQQYGWKFFLRYHSMSPEEAVQVLKLLDHIEDRRCEIWRRLPDDTILQERCSNIKSIFVVNVSSMVGNFELGEDYEKYVSELQSRWGSDHPIDSSTQPGHVLLGDKLGAGTRVESSFSNSIALNLSVSCT